jgi:transcriptional antiterminator RfaH
MLLTASEISSKGSLHWWFCLRSQVKREHLAAASLRQYPDVEAFCPRVRFRKRTVRGPVWFVEPMFPGYLFARFEYTTFHRQIRQGRGIRGFVQFGDRFGLLPDDLIDQLKARVGENEVVEINEAFVPGQNVQISQGPFQGLEALVTRSSAARDRVEILIEWMGRSLRAEANAADLLPLAVRRWTI